MKNATVKGKVVEKSETREVYSRYGYKVHRVSYAEISNGTGSIRLILWNEQIDSVSIGDTVVIENGYVSQFRGMTQLNVGKRSGEISVLRE